MNARPPEARLAAAATAGLGLVLLVIVLSVAIRLDAGPLGALRGVHRTAASLEVVTMLVCAWFAWRKALPVIVLTVFLSALGIAAGQNPPPAAALGNLLGGLALAAAFARALGRAHRRGAQNWRRLAHAGTALLAVQCALGAWLSIFVQGAWSWALVAHAELGLGLAAGAVWLSLRLARPAQRLALLGVALAVPVAGLSALSGQPHAASLAHAAAVALLVAAASYAHGRLT